MRRSAIALGLAVLAAAALSSPPAFAACTLSNITAAGFRITGTGIVNGAPAPVAAVGLATGDGAGHVSGILTYSGNGQIFRGVPFSGTYAVPDAARCIVTMTTNVLNVIFVVVNNGGLSFGIDTDQGATLTFESIPVRSTACTSSLVNGNYGLTLSGDRIDGNNPGPPAAVGWWSANGAGNFSGEEAWSKSGTFVSGTVTGTYKVNADCTGSGSIIASFTEGTRSFDMVVVNGGDTLFGIQTDSGRVTAVKLKKQ